MALYASTPKRIEVIDLLNQLRASQLGEDKSSIVDRPNKIINEAEKYLSDTFLYSMDKIEELKSELPPIPDTPFVPPLNQLPPGFGGFTEKGLGQEVEKFINPMKKDPDIIDLDKLNQLRLLDESAKETEELTDAEIADIATSAIDAAGEAQDNQPNLDDAPTGGLMSPIRDTAPLGKGYQGYLERYTTVDNVDFDFIKQLEGYKTDMYVPKIKGQVLENSGATIASGFDLGQRNESDLKGLPQSLINKLKPYLGKKKKAADDFVKANPLTITEKEADIINAFAKKQELDRLIKDWNNSSDVKWENLSKPQATTVASVAFQFGNLPTRTPKFWRYTTTGDWAAARDELRDFYGKDKKGLERQEIYGPRRDKEADYLEQDNAAILGTKAY